MKSTILNDIAMVLINISIWSGQKRLAATDFINVDVSDLPPSKVASFGSKVMIDKDRLRPMHGVRSAADRVCNRYGTRLLGGYAIPLDSIEVVSIELSELMQEYDKVVSDFMSEYDDAVDSWIKENPDFAEPLRRSVLPAREVRSRFRASFSIFEISASARDRSNSMDCVTNDLLDSVLHGHVQSLKPMVLRKDGHNKDDTFRADVRQTIKTLAGKLSRFSFCEASGGLKLIADDLVARSTGTGAIRGAEFHHLFDLLRRMLSVDDMRRLIASYAAGSVPHLGGPGVDSAPPTQADTAQVPPAIPSPVAPMQGQLGFGDSMNAPSDLNAGAELPVQAHAELSIPAGNDVATQADELPPFSFDGDDDSVCFTVNAPAHQEALSQSSFVGDFDKFADTFDF